MINIISTTEIKAKLLSSNILLFLSLIKVEIILSTYQNYIYNMI